MSSGSKRTQLGALAACVAAVVVVVGITTAQDLLSPADLLRLDAPAPDARVSYGDDPLQFGHLRLPSGPGPHPVVVFVHGGCWLSQFDIAHAAAFEAAVASEGYAVWSLEYRRVGDPGGGWPNTFLDVGRGADHLRTLAADYDLDLSRVIASGHSAGGQFGLWLAARPLIASTSELHVADPLPIAGVLALAPAPDLESLHERGVCGNVIDGLMGGSPANVPDRYRAASPMTLVPVDVPQVLVVGRHDRNWGPVGRSYHEAAKAAGTRDLTLIEAPESGHFEVIAPMTSTWPVVRDALDELFEAASP